MILIKQNMHNKSSVGQRVDSSSLEFCVKMDICVTF